jgi:hypothetical protein
MGSTKCVNLVGLRPAGPSTSRLIIASLHGSFGKEMDARVKPAHDIRLEVPSYGLGGRTAELCGALVRDAACPFAISSMANDVPARIA